MTKLHKMSSYIDHAITLVNYTSLYHITMCVHAAAVGGHVRGGRGGVLGVQFLTSSSVKRLPSSELLNSASLLLLGVALQ